MFSDAPKLSVGFASVQDIMPHRNQPIFVNYPVNNPVFSDPEAENICCSLQLPASNRSWITRKMLDMGQRTEMYSLGNFI